MADLQEAANQFIENLIAQNVTGLMGTFTPAAMQKAMSMGQGPQPQGPVTHKEVGGFIKNEFQSRISIKSGASGVLS